MEFNIVIKQNLSHIFRKYEYEIITEGVNYLRLVNKYIVLIFSYNNLENSITFWLGTNDDTSDKIEIDDYILDVFFNSKARFSNKTLSDFITNWILFSEEKGKLLLMGNLEVINSLEEFDLQRSRTYTDSIKTEQILAAADKAWNQHNYGDFIKQMASLDLNKVAQSYHLKLKIANKSEKN
jgi:hypothetical protein